MAAAEHDSANFQQKFKNITECPICMQTFADPRILPCVHTFCAKCLETAASKSGSALGKAKSCPICRKELQAPIIDRVENMPRDFFMVKLLEMLNIQNSSKDGDACDACSEDIGGDAAQRAELFCRKCYLKLCEGCCKHHRKSRLTKDHELISVDESFVMPDMESFQDLCEIHDSERLKIYCLQCKAILCAFCFIENHRNHKWMDINKVDEEYRQQIQTGIENLRKQRKQMEAKMREFKSIKATVDEIVSVQRSMISAKKNAFLQLMEKSVTSLISDLQQKRQEKLKEFKIEEEEFDFHKQIQDSYTAYCHEMVSKGSLVDICRVQSELRSRAEELQRMSQSVCQRKTKPFEVDLRLNRFDELQKFIEKSFVGNFEGEALHQIASDFEFGLCLGEKRVTGMAIIDQELFVTTKENSNVQVYNTKTFALSRSFPVNGLTFPEDMAASEKAKILYIYNALDQGKILRVNTHGTVLSSWVTVKGKIRISTSYESPASPSSEANVIVNPVDKAPWIIKEFQPSVLSRIICKTQSVKRRNFVVKLQSGRFLATYGDACDDCVHGMSEFEKDKDTFKITSSFTGELHCPEEIVEDQTNGSIFVNDRGNKRVLMLNSFLKYQKEIISRETGLCDPRCMVLDRKNRRLLIADLEKITKCARILAVKVD